MAQFTIYAWNIRTGGHGRNPEERRVEMTGVPRPNLYTSRAAIPILLGYEGAEDIFAAWDATKHRAPVDPDAGGHTNSLYVPHDVLLKARQSGFSSNEHRLAGSRSEVVVAFRPEATDQYLRIATAIRVSGKASISAAARAAGGANVPQAGLTASRVRVLRHVRQVVRSARFPADVLRAYGNRCAFCGLGATLVHAAHIKSVQQRGPDHVTNGLALCPTDHAAFDHSLIAIDDNFDLVINEESTFLLDRKDVTRLRSRLFKKVALPQDPDLQPDLRFIRFHRRRAGL